jgi:hypothetical protein
MDFEEMQSAYRRAITMTEVQTRATGEHIPTVVAQLPEPTHENSLEAQQLISRLLDQHAVRYDPICKEAAEAIEYVLERNRINLSKAEQAAKIMYDLYTSLDEITQSGKDWPWEFLGSGDYDKIVNSLDACRQYLGTSTT